jgi:hypothetical protein
VNSRPLRRGICDGDDVWPGSLTDEDLQEIAAIDAETKTGERERSERFGEIFGDVPVYSLAERVRHWIYLVEDTETGADLHPGEYMTELGCRELVANKIAEVSTSLREKLMSELLTPLDDRFEAATVDDGGTALAFEVKIDDRDDMPWWWRRRPTEFGPLWKRQSE